MKMTKCIITHALVEIGRYFTKLLNNVLSHTRANLFRFEISLEALQAGEEEATCPSCSLLLKVIYDQDDFIADEEKAIKGEKSTVKQTEWKSCQISLANKHSHIL